MINEVWVFLGRNAVGFFHVVGKLKLKKILVH